MESKLDKGQHKIIHGTCSNNNFLTYCVLDKNKVKELIIHLLFLKADHYKSQIDEVELSFLKIYKANRKVLIDFRYA